MGLRKVYPKSAVLRTCFPLTSKATSAPKYLPHPIMSLYHPKHKAFSHGDLMKECERVFKKLNITSEAAVYLADCTRLQSQSHIWYEHRRGRLTASKFKSICHTSPVNHQSHSSLKLFNQAHGQSLLRLAGVLTMRPLLESSTDYSKKKIMIHLN